MAGRRIALITVLLVVVCLSAFANDVASPGLIRADLPWWAWALLLFVFTIVLGVIAVIGGVGGGVLFVPIVSALFPFHFDFVRGAGLLVAVCGAMSAGPVLLRTGLASMRLGLPLALVGSIGSMLGAMIGLALPTNLLQGMLGVAVLGIVGLMLIAGGSANPDIREPDVLSRALGIHGAYHDAVSGRDLRWTVHRMPLGLATFLLIGILAGMFGLGAGWANVPALNLLLGAPIKVAVATSGFNLALTGSAAAWVYLNEGAVVPLIAIPSVAGMMIGTRIGARLLRRVRANVVRWVVIAILAVTGMRSLVAAIAGG